MNSLIALEELIKEEDERIALLQRQLTNHESGENKLSRLSLASTETTLEECQELNIKHKAMHAELLKQDIEKLEEKERIEATIKRKKYFENQNIRIKNNSEQSDDQKLEAMMILDELPEEINFEDDELFEIAQKSLELNLSNHKELNEQLILIRNEFESMLKNCKEENLSEIEMLNFRIPILVLHFSVLSNNIKNNFVPKENKDEEETQEEEKKSNFTGLPRYEDWWVQELWSSHQAYFALFKWKSIISNLCKTGEQKRSWTKIFDNWIFIKKLLNDKGTLAYDYHFALDALLHRHAQLDEELENKNLESMELIINRITKNEDFSTVIKNHNIETAYLKFKRKKLEFKS